MIDAPDSPHLEAHKIAGEMYFGCAETDSYAPTEMVESLQSHLEEIAINARVEWYPGTQHGFVFPKREGMYDKPQQSGTGKDFFPCTAAVSDRLLHAV